MLEYQVKAINRVREYAKIKNIEHQTRIKEICAPYGINFQELINKVLLNPVTINFHPDRYSNNRKKIIENLIEQGVYHGQFRTGTTNGGRTAFIGGDRFLWEQQLFFDAYPQVSLDRPKYGALNLFQYPDGASVRFGSCFLSLKHEIIDRCTFAYGDSSTNPSVLCTSDTFAGVLSELFNDVRGKGRLLNQAVSSEQEALAILMNTYQTKELGKNLDYCIEVHIHGDILLENDVDCFYIDTSFKHTPIGEQAETLCQKYKINLRWIRERQIEVDAIGEIFRGPMIPVLAQRIDHRFGNSQGIVNATLIGCASRDIFLNQNAWEDLGNEYELFQYLKQLWHTVGYFG